MPGRRPWTPIVERAAAIVREYETAVTLRQVHYRLVAEGDQTGYRNTSSDYKILSRITSDARREGTFPPLLDRTRTIDRPTTFEPSDWRPRSTQPATTYARAATSPLRRSISRATPT